MEKIEKFFSEYGKALEQGLVSKVSEFSGKPLVIVTDETKMICHSQSEIENINGDIIAKLKTGGVVKYTPKIIQSMRLSESVIFVKVRWALCDQNEKVVFNCYCSYTLQIDEVDLFKILIIVVDDEQKQFSQLMKQHGV
ncbi:hypothetical protein [Alteromonas sp. M12]|uniref:hypothetical protein n=1 Tax=Alteromonas sp. M12 TaxID=3135644 RepID=UPI00319E0273